MPKTGPHSFTDPTGVEWDIVGYSRVCGPAYVDCRSKDGVALTVRPLAYLAPAGLSLPADAEPPVRVATSSEKSHAHALAERMVGGPVEKPKVKRARKKKAEREGAQVIPLPTDDPVRAFDTALSIPTPSPGTPVQKKARVVNAHREGYDVLIARPSAWGNPYSHLPDTAAQYVVETRERAIDLYREWMRQRIRDGEPGLVQALASLHGLRLGCYCAPQACHGDVLVDAAAWAAEKLADFSTST